MSGKIAQTSFTKRPINNRAKAETTVKPKRSHNSMDGVKMAVDAARAHSNHISAIELHNMHNINKVIEQTNILMQTIQALQSQLNLAFTIIDKLDNKINNNKQTMDTQYIKMIHAAFEIKNEHPRGLVKYNTSEKAPRVAKSAPVTLSTDSDELSNDNSSTAGIEIAQVDDDLHGFDSNTFVNNENSHDPMCVITDVTW